jgi:hypothetical protein
VISLLSSPVESTQSASGQQQSGHWAPIHSEPMLSPHRSLPSRPQGRALTVPATGSEILQLEKRVKQEPRTAGSLMFGNRGIAGNERQASSKKTRENKVEGSQYCKQLTFAICVDILVSRSKYHKHEGTVRAYKLHASSK